MKFPEAMGALMNNHQVRRNSWGRLSHIVRVKEEVHRVQTTMFSVTSQGCWLPHMEDIFAEDWEIIDG